jgi:uncharacterized membrane protein YbaN (DUF454 family)
LAIQEMMTTTTTPEPRAVRSRLQRWLLVAGGVALVAIGAVGVFLPGLPTTVFLIGASWCFTRSCPWLEERLIRIPLFRPFFVYLDNPAQMPRRVVVWTLIVMWLAIAASATMVMGGNDPKLVLAITIVAAGIIGTWFVIRMGRRRVGVKQETDG